jgi:capsular polysaccharide biosynthesis protein
MELKEYLAIFRSKMNLFLGIVLLALILGVLFYFLQPVKYQAKLVLNVTRTGQEKTADYQYDDFYRLQADERFADTIVRWLETENIQNEIKKEAGVSENYSLTAKRLSSQMIDVEILAADRQVAEKIALAVSKVVNRESDKLNVWQQKENWFKVVSDEAVVSVVTWEWYKVILITLVLGIFVAFWAVLIRHYLE